MIIFVYGVMGMGKMYMMCGGFKLVECGVIFWFLSNVFCRGKKLVKDSNGEIMVDVVLFYYEIYNDKVFDLLELLEKWIFFGFLLCEKDGKIMVVGLLE